MADVYCVVMISYGLNIYLVICFQHATQLATKMLRLDARGISGLWSNCFISTICQLLVSITLFSIYFYHGNSLVICNKDILNSLFLYSYF